MEILSVAMQVAFYCVFLLSAWRYLTKRGLVELAVLAIFASTAAIFAINWLSGLMPGLAPILTTSAIAVLLAQPIFIIWLVHLIRPQPRWLVALYGLGFTVAALWLLLPSERMPAAVLFTGLYFAVAEGAAAVILSRIAQRRHGLPRLRLRLAALATMLFGLGIVAAAAGSVAVTPDETNPGQIVSRLTALAAGIFYLVAFLPPTWLHGVAQRAVAFDLSAQLVTKPTGTEASELWRELALAARALLGARLVEIVVPDGSRLAQVGVTDSVAADELARAEGGPVTVLDIAMVPVNAGAPHLVAEVEGRLLFVEDDVEVLRLLGAMTLREVERQDAIVRLGEARRELESAAVVRASEARFRALLGAVPSAVLAVDGEGLIVWATGPTGELLGMEVPELSERRLADFLSTADLELTAADDGRVRRAELSARRADGSTLPVDVAATDFELEGRAFELYVLSDASWRATANQLRDRFLGVLSHELRTPITSIYGGTHLLIGRSERLDPESQREVLGNIAHEAERLLRITENLVVLARVERGADFFEFRPVALRPVLATLVARERELWPGMDIQLEVNPGLPLAAADEDYLAQVLRNLISNAGKYAGSTAQVSVSAREEGDEIVLVVADNGPGLSVTDADQIFELYYRAPGSTATPGAGIGLFVCRSLVEAMGGRIWARSREEGGAEFGLSLPQYVEPDTEPAAEAIESTRTPRGST
ncbi:hypothetical protein BH23CHL7_BH23CHL7_13950 [soil metagenome]